MTWTTCRASDCLACGTRTKRSQVAGRGWSGQTTFCLEVKGRRRRRRRKAVSARAEGTATVHCRKACRRIVRLALGADRRAPGWWGSRSRATSGLLVARGEQERSKVLRLARAPMGALGRCAPQRLEGWLDPQEPIPCQWGPGGMRARSPPTRWVWDRRHQIRFKVGRLH